MNIQLNNLENSRVEFLVKVDKEEFNEALMNAFKKNVSKYNIPGFRKGKVPFNIFKKMYGVEVLYNDAANILIDKTYKQAIEEKNVEVVDYPEIEVLNCNENEEFEYKAVVYVKPEVKLGTYKGVEVKEEKYEVTDEDIDLELQSLREKNSRLISKEDGKIENENIAIIDFKGYIDDVAFEGGEGKDYSLAIGSKTFIDNFEDQLIGKSKGEKVTVNVEFPENYGVEELKGKPARFEVEIKEVKVKELPELDDNFAASFSEYSTLEELKNSIKEKLTADRENRQKLEFENSVIEEVCKNAEVYIPEPMVESEIDRLVQDFENKIRYQGIDLDKYCKHYGITLDDIRNNFKDRARKQVLSNLVLEEISKVEKIEASEEELNEKALELAKMYSVEEDKLDTIKDSLLKMYKSSLEKDIVFTKTVDFLVKESKRK